MKKSVMLVFAAFLAGFMFRGFVNRPGSDGKANEAEIGKRENGTKISEETSARPGRSAERGDGSAAAGGDRISLNVRTKNSMRMKHPVDRITAWVKELDGLTAANATEFFEAMKEADPKGERKLEWQALYRKWTMLDPEGCARFISGQPVTNDTHFAIDAMMNKWAEMDPGKASEFINSLEEGPLKDTALFSYIGRVGTSDIGAALAMADSALKEKPEEYNRSMQRLHGEYLFANQGGDSRAFFDLIPSQQGKEAAFGHVFHRLVNQSVDQAADWVVAQKSFATDRAIEVVVREKNAAAAGSGDAWKTANFP